MTTIPEPIDHTVAAIYRIYEDQPEEDRKYLGASTFGNECDRAMGYQFRLAHPPEEFDGRKLRLFQTGHREEARLIAELNEAGMHTYGHQY